MERKSSENVLSIVVYTLINKTPTFRNRKFKNTSFMNSKLWGHMVNIEPKNQNSKSFPNHREVLNKEYTSTQQTSVHPRVLDRQRTDVNPRVVARPDG